MMGLMLNDMQKAFHIHLVDLRGKEIDHSKICINKRYNIKHNIVDAIENLVRKIMLAS